MRSDRLLLQDILDAIVVVREYLPDDRGAFDIDPPLQSHIHRHVMIVGEAAYRLSKELKSCYPAIPWRQIEGMRHVLVHDYFKIDWEEVYDTAVRDIPPLQPIIQGILDSMSQE